MGEDAGRALFRTLRKRNYFWLERDCREFNSHLVFASPHDILESTRIQERTNVPKLFFHEDHGALLVRLGIGKTSF